MSTHKIADFLIRKFYLQGKSTCFWKETVLCQTHPFAFNGCSLKGRERQLISATGLLQAVRGQWGVEVLSITVIILAVVIIMIMLPIHLMVATGPGLKKRLKKDVIPVQKPCFLRA